jgi:hypothetical protein
MEAEIREMMFGEGEKREERGGGGSSVADGRAELREEYK